MRERPVVSDDDMRDLHSPVWVCSGSERTKRLYFAHHDQSPYYIMRDRGEKAGPFSIIRIDSTKDSHTMENLIVAGPFAEFYEAACVYCAIIRMEQDT